MIALLLAVIPLLAWYRFKGLALDRDYTPYAYPAIFKTGYLEDGHVDIKPPLIHWSYKCWLKITSILSKSVPQAALLRLLPFLGLSLAVLSVGAFGPGKALVLALLFASPTLWVHMANTEWLTVALWGLAMLASQAMGFQMWAFVFLGLTPWANQKNVLLIVPVAWALGLSFSPTALIAGLGPSVVILSYLALTGRLRAFWTWAYLIPKEFGKKRTFKVNTLSAARLLIPALALLAPLVAGMEPNRWAVVAAVYVAVMLSSKQIVPHHFIGLAFPVALAVEPNGFVLAGLLLIWLFRDGICWLRPETVYPLTFGGPAGHYGQMLEDGARIAAKIPASVERIWVNGMENNVYLQAGKKAWRVEIPELPGTPDGEPPEYIVHCATSAKACDYEGYGYEPVEISNLGLFTLMKRKP